MSDTFTVTNTSKTRLPVSGRVFKSIKDKALGKKYELSVAFVTPKESHAINKASRKKDKPTNILSFPLGKQSGEIIICPKVAKKEAPDFERTYTNYLLFLFIHGCVHLKGFDHGSRMEAEEQKVRKAFGI